MHGRLIVLVVTLAPGVDLVLPVNVILVLRDSSATAVFRYAYRVVNLFSVLPVKPTAEALRRACVLIPAEIAVISHHIHRHIKKLPPELIIRKGN